MRAITTNYRYGSLLFNHQQRKTNQMNATTKDKMNGIESAIERVQTTYAELCEFMANGLPSMVTNHNGKQYVGRIMAISLEDGSGKNFNVTILCGQIVMNMFTRFE